MGTWIGIVVHHGWFYSHTPCHRNNNDFGTRYWSLNNALLACINKLIKHILQKFRIQNYGEKDGEINRSI